MDDAGSVCLSKMAMEERAGSTVRRSERIHVNMPLSLRLQLGTTEGTFRVSTIDISELGARIRADAPLAPGQRIEVIPDRPDGPPVQGRVIWIGEVGTAQAGHAGIEFLQSFSAPV